MWACHPSKEEIHKWLESKEKEFAKKENIKPKLTAKDWLQRYVFTELHEICFASFFSELHVWRPGLATKQAIWPINETP